MVRAARTLCEGYCRRPILLVLSAVLVIVTPAQAQNKPPVADAGADQSIYANEYTVLQGSATDPDGNDIAYYLWTVESAPVGSSPTFTAPSNPGSLFTADLPGDYVLSLVASDGMDTSEPDYVTIYVAEILPPVADAQADVISGPAPLTVNFDGSGSVDPQGGSLTFFWSFGDSNASMQMSPTHTFIFPGVYTVALRVFDDLGQSDMDTLEITVCGTVYSGDFDEDCYVDFYDFAVLAAAWISEPGDSNWNRACDISDQNDNVIDGLDLAVFTGNWLSGI